ncbi:AsmA family protein [Chitinophagaceae bacterium MMS25-I14]
MKKVLFRILKISGITIGSLLLLLFLLPVLFPGPVTRKIKAWANNAITGELNFSKARLSFFNHFPSLTLTLYDFSLKGSAPFQQDTLVASKEIALGINLSTLFSKKINIDEIYLTRAKIHVEINEKGQANYNIYQSKPSANTNQPADTTGASLKIARIQIDESDIIYDDRSLPMLITAHGLNYLGKGDLAKDIFDLQSHLGIQQFNFTYGGQDYIHSKKIDANLVTKVNTRELAFIFEKNDLKINTLPVRFKGKMEFLKDGYAMDFHLISQATDLHDVFSALPPEYASWLDKTDIHGHTSLNAALTGTYSAATNSMPSLSFEMQVRDGFIAYDKAPAPIHDLYLDFKAAFPQFNIDSLYVNVDSIAFKLDKGYLNSSLHIQGLNAPIIHARLNSELDLGIWDRAFGLQPFDLKGICKTNFTADGTYRRGVVYKGWRKTPDTAIVSVPRFSLQSSMQNGYFKYVTLPEPLSNISFNINAEGKDSIYQHAKFSIDNINATLIDNYIRGFFHLYNADNYDMDGELKTILNLADVSKFYPLDMKLAGHLHADLKAKGKYISAKRIFPVTTAQLDLKDGSVQTKYYPHPIEQIQVSAQLVNTSGNMKSMKVNITPVSFLFEGQPFMIKADLQNFDNLKYDIASKGTIDIGKIYQVFSQKGTNVKGLIQTNLSLRGLQSDATAGRYNRLFNSGTMKLQDVDLVSEDFPKPLTIRSGDFHFQQDKMWFDQFKATYGSSHFTLNGYMSNVINYAMQKNAPLKGIFTLKSGLIVVDEMMAMADNKTTTTAPNTTARPAAPTAASGVVIVPSNLSLTLNAAARKVMYNGIDLSNFKGAVRIDSGKVYLDSTGFVIIGAPVMMNATYGSISPVKAFFTYHINAQDFDVKRAYNEIKVFHDLATSAGKVNGIISLDYKLAGKLDANMMPVYPSLKGGGTISLKKVKVYGLKLFGAVSKATGRDSVNNPDLSKVEMKSTIANNIITIERTKMKIMGFRPRIEGQVGLDGRMNLRFRLGLPPFGIFGIPMTITGTSENPKVHMRRGRDSDTLTEEKDESEGTE